MTNRSRTVFLALTLAWAGVIFYLSSQPSLDTPSLFPGQDKLFHLIAFCVLGFLGMGAMKASARGYHRRQAWLVVFVVMLYGISDEVHQFFVPERSMDSLDALADAIGGMLGVWAMFYVMRLFVRSAPADT